VGTKRMLEILTRIAVGTARMEDLDTLEELADRIKRTSLCGLGQTAPNPVQTTLKYFREEYEAHITDKKCPAGRCPDLTTFVINENCNGCTLCAIACPVDCIAGTKKELHVIDDDACIRCGVCRDKCKFDAVHVV
jgi:NADH-quinone oxidoreductase subunit F/NADP-reducing hydrogenase subunit HndC